MLQSLTTEHYSLLYTALFAALVDLAIKGTLILSLAALAAICLRRASAAARHLIWFLGIASLLVLPLLSAALPGWHVLPRWAETLEASAQPSAHQAASPTEFERVRALGAADSAPLPQPAIPLPAAAAPAPPPAHAAPAATAELTTRASPPPLAAAASQHLSLWPICAVAVWLAGIVLFLLKIAIGFMSLRLLQRRSSTVCDGNWRLLLRDVSDQLRFHRRVILLSSDRRSMPMTWGIWRIRLLIPADADHWTTDQRRVVLLHELAHARRRDCLTQLLAQLARAVHWFNPLAWLACSRMQAEREQACDDLVLRSGATPSAYAEQLLHIAAEASALPFSAAAIAMARPSKLEGRLRAILDAMRNRRGVSRIGTLIALAAALAIVIPTACMHASQSEYTTATIQLRIDASGRPAPVRVFQINDSAQLDKLLAFFPQIGRKSEIAGGWVAGATIQFARHDEPPITISVSANDDLKIWSEGHGDWPVKGDLKAFLTTIATAQTAPATLPAARTSFPPRGFARVVDVNGKPIAAARISGRDFEASVETGPDGLFRLPRVEQGKSIALDVTAPGFIEHRYTTLQWGQTGDIQPGNGLIELHRAGRLEGRILGSDGKPLAGAQLSVDVMEDYRGLGGFSDMRSYIIKGISDSNGRFVIQDVPPGYLLLYFRKEARTNGAGAVIAVHLEDGQQMRDLTLDTSKSIGEIEGRIVDAAGKPLQGAHVRLGWNNGNSTYPIDDEAVSPATSDSQGRYRLTKLPQGSWMFWASIGDSAYSLKRAQLSSIPLKFPDIVLSVLQTPTRLRRLPPMNPDTTVREWTDATLAGDTESAAAIVEPGSPFALHSRRILALLRQIKGFPSSSLETATASTTTNVLDLGDGRRAPLSFIMSGNSMNYASTWHINDVRVGDEHGKSLMADNPKPTTMPAWQEFESLLGKPIDAPEVRQFVLQYAMRRDYKFDSGEFSNDEGFSLLYRSNRIVRVIVRTAPDAGIYTGTLPAGLLASDQRADVIHRLGPPATSNENALIYPDRRLTLVFDSQTHRLSEIDLDAPRAAVTQPATSQATDVPDASVANISDTVFNSSSKPASRLVTDPLTALSNALPPGYIVQRVIHDTSPSYLEDGKGLAILIGLPPRELARKPHKEDESLIIWIMPPDYQGRDPHPELANQRQTVIPYKAASTPQANIFMWGDQTLGRKLLSALIVPGAAPSTPPTSAPQAASEPAWLPNPQPQISPPPPATQADSAAPIHIIHLPMRTAGSIPPAKPTSQPGDVTLTDDHQISQIFRIESYPADKAKPGICAIGLFASTDLPPLPDLYSQAIAERNSDAQDFIGSFPDESTPIKIVAYSRKGHEIGIGLAISPKKSQGSNYIWGEFMHDLPAGRYHVQLNGAEAAYRNGTLEFLPKTDIRASYQLECFFGIGQTRRQDEQWNAQTDAVIKTMRRLNDQLNSSQTKDPAVAAPRSDAPTLSIKTSATGEALSCWLPIQLKKATASKVPSTLPAAVSGHVYAFRDDSTENRKDFTVMDGPIHWDGKNQVRCYALDKQEFGWRFIVWVDGQDPQMVKQVNVIIDEQLSGLWSAIRSADSAIK